MSEPLSSNQEVHEPCCPPESRCVICWDDDDAVIKALVADRDRWERNFASERVNVEALRVEKSNLASRLRMIEQESQGKPTGTCPGTTRGNLGENSPALRLLPSAWMKVHRVPSTPDQAPGELDIECYAGDDPPDNEPGWIPLYRRAADETTAAPNVPHKEAPPEAVILNVAMLQIPSIVEDLNKQAQRLYDAVGRLAT